MNIAVIGRGLIGGSLEKAARRAGHSAAVFRGRAPSPDVSGFDVVFVALPHSAIVPAVRALAAGGTLKDGAAVVDICGVKRTICEELARVADGKSWRFVGGHPMAGKEKTGYENSCEDLFDGASMILTPYQDTPPETIAALESLFADMGFARTVKTTPERHDAIIAFTSQLCHVLSNAYVREPLAAEHDGFSAGSFRDLSRVGFPDPETWTELFIANSDALLAVLDRYAARLDVFRKALREKDAALVKAELSAAKPQTNETQGGKQ
jgi:prephenate dehydrogenase